MHWDRPRLPLSACRIGYSKGTGWASDEFCFYTWTGKVVCESCAWSIGKVQTQPECTREKPCRDRAPQITAGRWCCRVQSCKGAEDRELAVQHIFSRLNLSWCLGQDSPHFTSVLSKLPTQAKLAMQMGILHRQEYSGGTILFTAAGCAHVHQRRKKSGCITCAAFPQRDQLCDKGMQLAALSCH